MKRATGLVTSGGVFLFLLVACSGSGGSEGGGGTCAQYVSALRSYFDRCGDGTSSSVLTNASARLEAACNRGLTAPGATNMAAQIAACTQKVQAASCDGADDFDCELTGGTLEDGAPCGESYQCKGGACRTAPGETCGKCAQRVPIGGDCTSSSECVEGAGCLQGSGDTGKCVAEKIAKAGEKCSGEGGELVRCDAGLSCSFTGGELTCKAPGAAGADCSSRLDCLNDLRCVKGKCADGLAEGGDCTFGSECAKGLDCSRDKKCARVVYVKAGEECDSTRRCERGSCRGMQVTLGPNGTTEVKPGKCVDPLPDGAACSESSEDEDAPSCDVFAECIGGKCTVVDPATCK